MGQPRQDQPADLYEVLGVDARAARADIVRAYRQRARASHPDTQPGDPDAEGRFQLVWMAYHVLADPGRRAAYDQAHPGAGRRGGHPGQRAPAAAEPATRPPAAGGQPIPVRRVTHPRPAEPGGHAGWPPLWAGPVVAEPADGDAGTGGPPARYLGLPPRPVSEPGWYLPDLGSWWL